MASPASSAQAFTSWKYALLCFRFRPLAWNFPFYQYSKAALGGRCRGCWSGYQVKMTWLALSANYCRSKSTIKIMNGDIQTAHLLSFLDLYLSNLVFKMTRHIRDRFGVLTHNSTSVRLTWSILPRSSLGEISFSWNLIPWNLKTSSFMALKNQTKSTKKELTTTTTLTWLHSQS